MVHGFDDCLARVLVSEGGKVDDPRDPGGRTNKGIIQRVYDGWRTKRGEPTRDVYDITDDEVRAIYRAQYWEPIKGDQLPEGLNYVVMDGGVHSGPGQSVKWLQRSLAPLYTGAIDGVLGEATLGAIAKVNDIDALIAKVIARRETFLRALKTFKTYGRGWIRRTQSVLAVGQAWATGSVGPATPTGGAEKAVIEDAKQAPGKGVADGATGGGLLTGGTITVVKQLQDQLTPFSIAGNWISTLVVVLAITAAVLTVGGLAYRVYSNKRKAELADALDLQSVSK